jgi:small subunit ribosomal protein S3
MIEKKFVGLKKNEFAVKEFVASELGKGKISRIGIERTPVGEKIIVHTSRPGLIIGQRGEKIARLTEVLKKQFNMENPHVEILEVQNPALDAQCVAEEIALSLERFGSTSFKIIAYKTLQRIKDAGALGAEIRLSGKLPSERAKSWRFAFGYLKKTGEQVRDVRMAETVAQTIPGTIGVKVEITPPDTAIGDKIIINKDIIAERIQQQEAEKEAAKRIEEEKGTAPEAKTKEKIKQKGKKKKD